MMRVDEIRGIYAGADHLLGYDDGAGIDMSRPVTDSEQPVTMSCDDLVDSFLAVARKSGVAALVTYGYRTPDGRSVMKISSNSDEAGSRSILAWMSKIDEATVIAAAKGVHDAERLCPICCAFAFQRVDEVSEVAIPHHSSFERMARESRQQHIDYMRLVIRTIRERLGVRPS